MKQRLMTVGDWLDQADRLNDIAHQAYTWRTGIGYKTAYAARRLALFCARMGGRVAGG